MRIFHPVLQKHSFQLIILFIFMKNYGYAPYVHFIKASTFMYVFSREFFKNPFPILKSGQLINSSFWEPSKMSSNVKNQTNTTLSSPPQNKTNLNPLTQLSKHSAHSSITGCWGKVKRTLDESLEYKPTFLLVIKYITQRSRRFSKRVFLRCSATLFFLHIHLYTHISTYKNSHLYSHLSPIHLEQTPHCKSTGKNLKRTSNLYGHTFKSQEGEQNKSWTFRITAVGISALLFVVPYRYNRTYAFHYFTVKEIISHF